DKLTLGNFLNTLTVSNAETVAGGSSTDLVTLGQAEAGGFYDLGAGTDRLVFNADGATVTVANIETITGSAAADKVTVSGTVTAAIINLGAGADSVTLNGASSGVTLQGVE
ncbi:hypothetical protein J8J27_24530, partial [Mycobacterium tuberculosis]|nr:hypothetical protein [Mycobacterium tuberculosis]